MRKSLALLFLILLAAGTLAVPQRIISTMPSITEILFAMGLEERVAGVTTLCNYPPEARLKPKIGREAVNLEKIVAL
jgi:iron complex transport system substrate-binding protein